MSFVTLQNALSHWTPFFAASAFVLSLVLLGVFAYLERRITRLTGGRNSSLEETLAVLNRDMKEVHTFRAELESYLKLAESRLRGAVSGVGIVRFNPFREGNGGNQSFSLALIDEHGSGAVISTLYSRDRVGVYAKPVDKGRSNFELSDEEREAIAKAAAAIAGHKKV